MSELQYQERKGQALRTSSMSLVLHENEEPKERVMKLLNDRFFRKRKRFNRSGMIKHIVIRKERRLRQWTKTISQE